MGIYFDPTRATSDEPGRQGERLWDFLERSSWDRSASAREQLTRFLDLVPASQRGQFVARLKSSSEREVLAANSELFLHAVMVGVGHQCELDAAAPGGSATDIRLGIGTHLEVHRSSLSDSSEALRRRRRNVVAGLEKVSSPNFWLSVRMSVGSATPSVARIRRVIERWVAGLDWESERSAFEASPATYTPPSRRWPHADGHILLDAMPKSAEQRDSRWAVGTVSGGPLLIEGFESLEKNVSRKRRQHDSLTEDLVVVLDLTEGITHRDEVAAAVYGPVVDYVSANPRYQRRDRTKGTWPEGSRASPRPAAVLTVDHLTIRGAQHAEMVLWIPPGFPNPIGEGPWEVVTLAEDGQTLRTSGRMADLADVLAAAFARCEQ